MFVRAQPRLLTPDLSAVIQQAHIPTGVQAARCRKDGNQHPLQCARRQFNLDFLHLPLVETPAEQFDHSTKSRAIILDFTHDWKPRGFGHHPVITWKHIELQRSARAET